MPDLCQISKEYRSDGVKHYEDLENGETKEAKYQEKKDTEVGFLLVEDQK